MTARQKWALQCNNCFAMCPVPPQNTVEEARVQANAYHDWKTVDREDVCRNCQKLPKYKGK